MRTHGLSLVGVALLAVMLGPAGIAAQTGGPAIGLEPVLVTGTVEFTAAADGSADGSHVWTASDPRLSGSTVSGLLPLYDEPAEDAAQRAAAGTVASYEIANADGGWRWVDTRPCGPVEARDPANFLLLSGTGAYDGLSAYVLVDWSEAPYAFNGFITPAELPPYGVHAG